MDNYKSLAKLETHLVSVLQAEAQLVSIHWYTTSGRQNTLEEKYPKVLDFLTKAQFRLLRHLALTEAPLQIPLPPSNSSQPQAEAALAALNCHFTGSLEQAEC